LSRPPDQSRRIRRSTLVLTAVALVFYLGYIVLTVYRAHR
jgi:uncharacterized membrane protein (DUF485 family)